MKTIQSSMNNTVESVLRVTKTAEYEACKELKKERELFSSFIICVLQQSSFCFNHKGKVTEIFMQGSGEVLSLVR